MLFRSTTKRELITKAKEAMQKAYVPYSNFQVGAAVLTKKGTIYTGCNIENASFGATNCAERTAIFKAVSEGEREIVAIAIVGGKNAYTYPCGICRQVIAEFMDEGILLFENEAGEILELSLEQMLPYSFTKKDL